ncbi:hypothetical protein DAEQUDRAFT_389266 [Daedalea quercina L-15889]|uniref:Uncharacterized protein n=1 Tax=Daedalea quercina L-15889 TaxID=1314783 RepID=A0A165NZG5_9APHY|nr:hypothetical protein DAEQUDRAFT_389266 [Daedalea quercina L-15889]
MLRLKAVRLDWVPGFLQRVSTKTIEGVTVIFDVRRPQPDDTMSIRDRLLQTLDLQLCTAVDGLLCGIEDPHARQNSVDRQSMDKSGVEKGSGEASPPVYTYTRLHTVQFALWVRSETLKSVFDSMEWTELLQGRFPLLRARKMLRAVVVLEDSTDFLHEK